MSNCNRILFVVQMRRSITRCMRCDKGAIVVLYDGSWRCVHCNPKKFTWNKETKMYEADD